MEIDLISPKDAEVLCRKITADLPEYFGLPEANEHYAFGVQSRINFAAKINGNYIGLLCLELPYATNANIYWMGILRNYHRSGVGKQLIDASSQYAKQHGAITMTVETLAELEADENYLKTYQFYESCGFMPMFNLKPDGYEWNMVYMVKNLMANI